MFESNFTPILGSSTAKSGLTFSKIISGTSKTLNFINQAIPVYYNTKPLFKNASLFLKAFKNTSTNFNDNSKKKNVYETRENEREKQGEIMYSSLTFFQ